MTIIGSGKVRTAKAVKPFTKNIEGSEWAGVPLSSLMWVVRALSKTSRMISRYIELKPQLLLIHTRSQIMLKGTAQRCNRHICYSPMYVAVVEAPVVRKSINNRYVVIHIWYALELWNTGRFDALRCSHRAQPLVPMHHNAWIWEICPTVDLQNSKTYL